MVAICYVPSVTGMVSPCMLDSLRLLAVTTHLSPPSHLHACDTCDIPGSVQIVDRVANFDHICNSSFWLTLLVVHAIV